MKEAPAPTKTQGASKEELNDTAILQQQDCEHNPRAVAGLCAVLARHGFAVRQLESGFVVCRPGLTLHCTDSRVLAVVARRCEEVR